MENTVIKLKTEIQFAKDVEVFSPGAWRRSEAGVARSAAGRGSDHTPESGTQSPTVGETEMGLQTFEKHKPPLNMHVCLFCILSKLPACTACNLNSSLGKTIFSTIRQKHVVTIYLRDLYITLI